MPDQTNHRDRIAAVAVPFFMNFSDEASAKANAGELADALANLLPPPADRAAVLREAADAITAVIERDRAYSPRRSNDRAALGGAREIVLGLIDNPRRVADEAQQPTAEEIARGHVLALHLIGEQLAGIESWMWEHLADVRNAAKEESRG